MSKKTVSIFMFLFSVFNLFSQDYENVIKEDSFWDTTNYFYHCSENTYLTRNKIGKDTIINGKSYKKILKGMFNGFVSNITSCFIQSKPAKIDENNFSELKDTFIREDSSEKKVYILVKNNNDVFEEYTLYDFNLKAGDKMTNPYNYGGFNTPPEFIINSIDYDNNGRKRFHYSISSYNGYYTEGIGSNNGIIRFFNFYGSTAEILFCWGNTKNQNGCVSETLTTKRYNLDKVTVFPNPVKDILAIKNSENIIIKIFSSTGSLLKTSISKSNLEIDISSFKSGIYILEASNSSGKKRSKILKI